MQFVQIAYARLEGVALVIVMWLNYFAVKK
jgi:hypothetical protein